MSSLPTDGQEDDSWNARFVSLLWTLKRAVDQAPPGSVPGVHYVHFHALRKDAAYREDLLRKMLESKDAGIRSLAEEVVAFSAQLHHDSSHRQRPGTDGALAAPPIPGGQAAGPASMDGPSDRRKGGGMGGVKVLLLILILIASSAGIFVASETGIFQRMTQIPVEGSLVQDTHWHSGSTYRLRGLVFVEGTATLTIDPGARILGEPGSALIVTRDARINARGSAQDPIVFTSASPVGSRHRGDWGGVVLLGNAPTNTEVAHVEGLDAGDPRGFFGGQADSDSCGILHYVRIEYAGHEISKDNELNGLTLGGCGSGTILRFVQVHMGLDDGIELFGGSANLSHVVISGAADDGLDWDRGWTGFGQFIVIQQDPSIGDNGIEADNLKSDPDASPRSAPTLSNVTIVGGRNPAVGQRGMVLRRGTGGNLLNVLVADFSLEAIDVRDPATVAQAERGVLRTSGLVLAGGVGERLFELEQGEADDDGGFDESAFFLSDAEHAAHWPSSPLTHLGPVWTATEFVPEYDGRLVRLAVQPPQGEFWDEAAGFIGALRPGARTSWLEGWTDFAEH
ncbi:hypothetical protein [Imhoffiella purpurea]|uniref:Right handed beta helix domain-containing protein n=1 Tax=Imhoffiella purpurea TaxID=1249627 RepID=W9VYJ3_9GAMM|nr:hypothetical protein [Imhoffiella purpurea]EXJ15460.1 hypothetical protein D779_1202 [Imhoffiella purpurea]